MNEMMSKMTNRTIRRMIISHKTLVEDEISTSAAATVALRILVSLRAAELEISSKRPMCTSVSSPIALATSAVPLREVYMESRASSWSVCVKIGGMVFEGY